MQHDPLLQDLLQVTVDTKLWREDISILEFRESKKVDETPYDALPLIIENLAIYGLLVDDESSCNVLYV